MSLCYDFEKWTITLVAVSLTIGLILMQYAHGYVDGNNNGKDDVKEYYETRQEINQTNNNTISVENNPPLEALFSTNNTYFSTDVPDNWTYVENYFYGQKNLVPSEFGEFLLNNTEPLNEKMKDRGVFANFQPDWHFYIKNAGLDLYVKYEIDKQDGMQVTSKQNVTIDGEPAVKVYGDGIKSFSGIKFVEYMTWHEKQPYYLGYMANVKDYQKYLPQFEQIVKTFKFIDEK